MRAMSKSKKDEELIRQAMEVNYTRWYEIESLIEQAENEETKRTLKTIQVSKYHKDEASCGIL